MFEGFPDEWFDEIDSLPPPNPESWEVLVAILTLSLIGYLVYQGTVYGF